MIIESIIIGLALIVSGIIWAFVVPIATAVSVNAIREVIEEEKESK